MDDHDEDLSSAKQEFEKWLKANNLHSYQAALEEQGYEDLISIVLLSEEEIEELATAISMRPGHRKKLPIVIKEQEEKHKREKEQERAKREREEEEQQEKYKREKEQHRREKDLEEELANIEREEKLLKAKAHSTRDAEGLQHESAKGSRGKGKQRKEEKEEEMKQPEKESNLEDLPLPPNRKHHFFASHKVIDLFSHSYYSFYIVVNRKTTASMVTAQKC
jgi:hypothetical protein